MEAFATLVERIAQTREAEPEELVRLIEARGEAAHALRACADAVRRQTVGDAVQLRGIIEFSNHCAKACAYCGLRAPNAALRRFRMEADEIVQSAEVATRAGYRTLVLQSGEDAWYTREKLADIIRRIKWRTGTVITLSVGERSVEDYAAWKQAGADKVLLKHETADAALYARLHADAPSLEKRAGLLQALGALGYEAGGGFMVGLPGQTVESHARDILLLRSIGCRMAGMGPFLPSPGTPLAGEAPGDVERSLNIVAATRILLGWIHLPATSALGLHANDGGKSALLAGANVLMRKVEPQKYRELYRIYPRPGAAADEAESHGARVARERQEVEALVREIGRYPL